MDHGQVGGVSRRLTPLRQWGWLALCSVVLCAGCSKSNSLVSVTGSVFVKGAPADGAQVIFHPVIKPKGAGFATPAATAGSDGVFSVVSGVEKGIPVGSYQVTVIWPDPAKKPKNPTIMAGGDSADIPDLLQGTYGNPSQSKLTVKIDAQTKEIPRFELDLPAGAAP